MQSCNDIDVNKLKAELDKKKLQFVIKRIFDFVIAAVLIVVLSPLLLFLVLWIKLDSKGEAVFKQTRIGLNGEPYIIYKFRTMVKNADKMFDKKIDENNIGGFIFQDKGDKRITRAGKFLRKTSLDELPQLFNILGGNMSLIGPRPEIPDIVDLYSDFDRIRLLVKPGVSGLAQVNGRGDLELNETIAYDVEYVKKFSLWMDLKIFLKTFKVVFTREGAY
jgi:lipopolysaccharide/colanic/teichoic acid biosynthesis glycosyltransferase